MHHSESGGAAGWVWQCPLSNECRDNRQTTDTCSHCRPTVGMLVFKKLISQYENFKSRDSSSTRNLTQHYGMDDALIYACMLQHSRHDTAQVAQLWLGGGPWEVQRQGKLQWSQITKRDHLSHSLVSYQTCRQTTVLLRTTMNSWSLIILTGWACVQFNGGISLRH